MPSADNQPSRFIFLDPQGRRWPRLRRVLVLWGGIAGLGLVWFIWALFVPPELRLPISFKQLKGKLTSAASHPDPTAEDLKVGEADALLKSLKTRPPRALPGAGDTRKGRSPHGEVRLGFYVDWDANAWQALEEHAASLTHIAPEWLSLVGAEGRLEFEPEPRLTKFAGLHSIVVLPLLTNLSGDTWQPEAVENLARGSLERRTGFINDLIAKLKSSRAGGIIIDWQQLDPNYTDDYTTLIVQMAEALHAANLEIWLMISPGEDFATFDLDALQLTVDRYVAVLHDENSESDPPGPIASLPWLENWMNVMTKFGEPGQWVGALGAYAYDWNITTHHAESISFKDAMTRASYAGVDQGPKPVLVGPKPYNGMYSYSGPDGEHRVTFLDAITFYNHLRSVRENKLGGFGVYRLGTEDPQLWDLIDAHPPFKPATLQALGKLLPGDTITHMGRGEVVSVDDSRDPGVRIVSVDAAGLLAAKYVDFPTYPTLYHQGATNPHQVAITFDDGPDPVWTPKVLEILRQRGLKACFFLIGKNVEAYPKLVQQIVAEGHEIGNHSYSHGNLAAMKPALMKVDLNRTQWAIEEITGRSTTLFRPPYNADSNPTDIADLMPLKIAEKDLGYVVVLEQIDPQDWARPGADVIVQRVRDQRSNGNIVLLHDAGGDRSQTVEALPRIIDFLQARGDSIVPISTLLDIPRDELMPLLTGDEQRMERIVTGTGFRIWHVMVGFFWSFMIFATILVAGRTLLVAWLAHRHFGSLPPIPPAPPAPANAPAVSVIIAAYNEKSVIAKTLRSVLDTDYPGRLEVTVVDDGSRDGTAEEIETFIASTGETRLKLLRQSNGGKASALRHGVAQASNEFVVFLDADTQFERGTIRALVAPFANPLVGAVSGNARVGNLRTFIARCQSLEYICGFNLDRRAYTEWNCITVVPGAVSAFRKSAIAAAGGFSHDTLAEDTDLTLTLHRLRYRIEFAPAAVAWTEAPETFRTLARQRFRWAFGTMQCLWKHRDLVFNPSYGALGWFSLPNIWFFQIGLVAITPFVDALLLWSIIFGTASGLWWYFLIFMAMELGLSALACRMEGEPVRRAWISIPMRLVYRPMLAWVVWRSIFRALSGAIVGWGKLERTASVPSRA